MERVVIGVPVTTDPVGLLVAVGVEARPSELLQSGDAGGAGADDAVSSHGRRPSIDACDRRALSG